MVLSVSCKKCNKKVPTNEVRLQADKTFVCFTCAGYQADRQSGNTPFRTSHPEPDAPKVEKQQFQCLKCKYTFLLKIGHPKKCPYCNGINLEEKRGQAQKLLDMHVSFRADE